VAIGTVAKRRIGDIASDGTAALPARSFGTSEEVLKKRSVSPMPHEKLVYQFGPTESIRTDVSVQRWRGGSGGAHVRLNHLDLVQVPFE